MYNYSDISLGKLEEDLKNTIEECKDLVSNIKSSKNIDLSNFNELESAIYDLSGRIAFVGDVHPDEKIRNFGSLKKPILKFNQFTYDYVKLYIGYFCIRIPVWEGFFSLFHFWKFIFGNSLLETLFSKLTFRNSILKTYFSKFTF